MERTTLPPVEDEFTRALLRSAEHDEPSSLAFGKVAAELGLGVGVGLGVSASMPASAALAGATALSNAARWSSSTAARLAALGASGVFLVGGAVALLRGPSSHVAAPAQPPIVAAPGASPPRAPASPFASHESLLPAVSNPPHAPGRLSVPAPLTAVAPLAPLAPSTTGAPRAARGAASSSSSSRSGLAPMRRFSAASNSISESAPGARLAEQVQSLDRARVALGTGDSGGALREIARYRSVWPKGVFLTEASVLEIEALAARGERSLAGLRAAAFVAAHPDSPQADRLRSLIPAQNR